MGGTSFNTDQFRIDDKSEDTDKWSPIEFFINDKVEILGKIQYNDSIAALWLQGNSIACFYVNLKTFKVLNKQVVCFSLGNRHGSASVNSVLIDKSTLSIVEEQVITHFTWDENEEQSEPVEWKNEYEWLIDNPESGHLH